MQSSHGLAPSVGTRGICTGDGKPVAYEKSWKQVVTIVQERKADTYVTHVKAHKNPSSQEGFWSNWTDVLAKQGALLTSKHQEEEVIFAVTSSKKQAVNPEIFELQTLQENEEEIEQLLEKWIIKGKWEIHWDSDRMVWSLEHNSELEK